MMSGAIAIAPSPVKKKKNIQGINLREPAGADENSRQTTTPQKAETIVAPCPMAYDTAGPTNSALEATKLATAPVDQMTLPRVPKNATIPSPTCIGEMSWEPRQSANVSSGTC